MAEDAEGTKEEWEPPTDWSDMRKVRAWLKLIITNYGFAGEMLEWAAHMLAEVVRCEQEALPPLPEGEVEPEEPSHKKLVDYLKGPGAEAPKGLDKPLVEQALAGQAPNYRWKPNWNKPIEVRSWLTTHAHSRENLATMLEGLEVTLRAMGQRLRDARPPWPVEPPRGADPDQ
jgi:hypothetical protein